MAISKSQQPPEVPKPPEIKRRVRFHPTQLIGMPIIMLLPVLGLFGVFDTAQATATAEQSGINVQVDYPSKFRHKIGEPMRIQVENNSGASVPKLVVKMSRSYFDAFENVQFVPEPQEIDATSITFEFPDVKAGDTRQVEVEMEASDAGTHKATVEAGPENGSTAQVEVETFVLP